MKLDRMIKIESPTADEGETEWSVWGLVRAQVDHNLRPKVFTILNDDELPEIFRIIYDKKTYSVKSIEGEDYLNISTELETEESV